ncbi:transcription factor Ouib-like [Teleopsis dalmanni]|uniref:transcription factor Ouib-like n=1 Tax=Teleopsis dalmanni TaxID=139649 RepID=UPI0018CD2736|nr:transcription factor Ouib-like [Teleopsis dalmanni]
MTNLCRLCVSTVDPSNAIDIFKEHYKKNLEIIESVIDFKLVDSLPQYICLICENMVEEAHKFRIRCKRAQQYFNSQKFKVRCNNALSPQADLLTHDDVIEDVIVKDESSEVEYVLSDITTETESKYCDTNEYDSETNTIEEVTIDEAEMEVKMSEDKDFIDNHAEIDDVENKNKEDDDMVIKQIIKEIEDEKKIFNENKKKNQILPYMCERCGHSFSSWNQCLAHMRRHVGDKPFHCTYCPSKFVTNTELKRHVRTHTGERPYKCSYCESSFSDLSTKVQHERSHTNERPYKCKHCGKGFRSTDRLKNHALIHTGERNFSCTICDKSFQRRTHLTAHNKSKSHKKKVSST